MRKEGVQIGRPFPPFMDWCRISTGTIDEVKLFNSALEKVMGQAKYVADMSLPGMLHAKLLVSPIPHGNIASAPFYQYG